MVHRATVPSLRRNGQDASSEVRFHVLHTGGQSEAVIAGEFLGDRAQLEPIMGNVNGLDLGTVAIDPRPDDMAVLAAVLVDVKDDSARLRGKSQLVSSALDQFEILRAGKAALRRIGIDGQAIEIFEAFRRPRLRLPFLKGAVQVVRDGAAHFEDIDALIVVVVEELGGQILAAVAPVALEDHGGMGIRIRNFSFVIRSSL